jgi:SRSO17 transposase
VDTRGRAEQYVRALLGNVERKNGWQMSEYLGAEKPYALQHFLGRANWCADAVRDEILRYALRHFLGPGENGVLIVDETGFIKKGVKSVGVQRQYSGTAGKVENCQIGVFLALSCPRGRVLIDRELYMPRVWCEDASRRAEASVPTEVRFSTKPRLALTMLSRAFAEGFSPDWVLGDEVYGSDGGLRRFLEERGQAYVLAVGSRQRIASRSAESLGREFSPGDWERLSAGDGMKGPRVYEWAARRLEVLPGLGLARWLLLRRSLNQSRKLSYYLCLAPLEAGLADLARAAGRRWNIECCFETAKQETGLDEYEVRKWHGWYGHVTLSMLALLFLSVVRAISVESGKKTPDLSR